ncbi:MAG: amidohydrolase [Chloroflexi bacterium]|nr:amidohydrolase [Chloroflexota bacterium]
MIIDVHHHWMPREHVENIRDYLLPGQTLVKKGEGEVVKEGPYEMFNPARLYYTAKDQVRHLDEAGIDMAALSVGCYNDWVTSATAPGINNAMAAVQSEYPRRIIGLAQVNPLEDDAPRELERSIKELGLKGVSFNTNTRGLYPDAREFAPLYRKVAELDIPVVVHAACLPHDDYMRRVTRQDIPGPLVARAIDHMLVTARLITGPLIREFPTIKFIFGHLGGAGFFPIMNRLGVLPGTPLYAAMKSQLFFDTAPVGWGKLALQTAVAAYGADNVVMGSDYPAVPNDGPSLKQAVQAIEELELPARDKGKILGDTAARLFKVG